MSIMDFFIILNWKTLKFYTHTYRTKLTKFIMLTKQNELLHDLQWRYRMCFLSYAVCPYSSTPQKLMMYTHTHNIGQSFPFGSYNTFAKILSSMYIHTLSIPTEHLFNVKVYVHNYVGTWRATTRYIHIRIMFGCVTLYKTHSIVFMIKFAF